MLCVGAHEKSPETPVSTPRAPCQAARPAVFAVFADFGVDDGFGLAQASAAVCGGVFALLLCQVGFLLLHPPPRSRLLQTRLRGYLTSPFMPATLRTTLVCSPAQGLGQLTVHPLLAPPLGAESGSSTNGNFFMNRAMAYSASVPVMPVRTCAFPCFWAP